MLPDRTSQTIAHFIGYFDSVIEEARLRIQQSEGRVLGEKAAPPAELQALAPDFATDFSLRGFIPDVPYRAPPFELYGGGSHFHHAPIGLGFGWQRPVSFDPDMPRHVLPGRPAADVEQQLHIFAGPGSIQAQMFQVNVLYDDDYLDLTDQPHERIDMSFVAGRLSDYADAGAAYGERTTFDRPQDHASLDAMAKGYGTLGEALGQEDRPPIHADARSEFVATGDGVKGIHVNGELREEMPVLKDLLPDRGLAAPPAEEAEDAEQTTAGAHGPAVDSIVVDAGANVVANIAAVTNVGIIAPVMSVMGDYHQVDVISQAYVYSDVDHDGRFPAGDAAFHAGSATQAFNIAAIKDMAFALGGGGEEGGDAPPVFPTDWVVSRIDGDVCFMEWIEQYNFVSDNDQLVITTRGSEVSILSGGNTALNVSTFFGMSMQYDLVIVGGNVIDMNVINQLAVLYDNDWLVGSGAGASGVSFDGGGNLIWNQASITNVGSGNFQEMPGYMSDVIAAIDERDPNMPAGLAGDAAFQGQHVLSVLYITGNVYQLNYVNQVSILGDADHVSQLAANMLAETEDASVTIRTGNNAVINIAEIVDYDSFGGTTYLGGGLYTDAILIQGGIIEQDDTHPQTVGTKLANEVIAFLDDTPDHPGTSGDGVIDAGHDYSWNTAMPSDAMQTVIA